MLVRASTWIAAAVTFLAGSTIGFSQESQSIDTELESISGQYAECAAYYRLVFYAVDASGEKETASSYRELEDNAMFNSLLLASEGRDQDLAVEVTNSRIEMYLKKMKLEANNRNENISILINKYHFECQELSENPPTELANAMQRRLQELEE